LPVYVGVPEIGKVPQRAVTPHWLIDFPQASLSDRCDRRSIDIANIAVWRRQFSNLRIVIACALPFRDRCDWDRRI
jgi:hypothetical protein